MPSACLNTLSHFSSLKNIRIIVTLINIARMSLLCPDINTSRLVHPHLLNEAVHKLQQVHHQTPPWKKAPPSEQAPVTITHELNLVLLVEVQLKFLSSSQGFLSFGTVLAVENNCLYFHTDVRPAKVRTLIRCIANLICPKLCFFFYFYLLNSIRCLKLLLAVLKHTSVHIINGLCGLQED